MKALLDTCIIIDVLQKREPFSLDGEKIFIYAANNLFNGCITAKSVTDIYYLLHKTTHDNEKTKEILCKLFALFNVIDTTGTDIKNAVFSLTTDYEDAVMIESAIRENVDCIITRNECDYKKSSIKIYTPNKFVSLFEDASFKR